MSISELVGFRTCLAIEDLKCCHDTCDQGVLHFHCQAPWHFTGEFPMQYKAKISVSEKTKPLNIFASLSTILVL